MSNKSLEENNPETREPAICNELQKMLDDLGLESIDDLQPTKIEDVDNIFYWEKLCYDLDDTPMCPLLSIGRKVFIQCQRSFCAFYVAEIEGCGFIRREEGE